MKRPYNILLPLLFILSWFGGCAGPSEAEQSALLATQQSAADRPTQRRQLFYIGLALFPQQWSENDVADFGSLLSQNQSFHVVQLIASNTASEPRRYPVADDKAIAALVRTAVEHARSDDIVFVHISTHGNRGSITRQLDGITPKIMTAAQLATYLSPLNERTSIIIVSACYSGSLIPSLQAPRRIIITASRADRSSFGCGPSSRHTYFGEAELRAFAGSGQSLQQIVDDLRETVANKERLTHHTASEPQVWVGGDAADLYAAKLF
jgi:hypothetical protein